MAAFNSVIGFITVANTAVSVSAITMSVENQNRINSIEATLLDMASRETGASGEQGITGASGQPGEQGDPGASGQQGASGNTGPPGQSGPSGGPQGPQGPTGDAGVQGESGQSGLQGLTGASGIQGPSGETGPIGVSGGIGETGQQGISGIIGETGATGQQGVSGITGEPGQTGQQGVIGSTGSSGSFSPANQNLDMNSFSIYNVSAIDGPSGAVFAIGASGNASQINIGSSGVDVGVSGILSAAPSIGNLIAYMSTSTPIAIPLQASAKVLVFSGMALSGSVTQNLCSITSAGLVTYTGSRSRPFIFFATLNATNSTNNCVVTFFFVKNPAQPPSTVSITTTQARSIREVIATTQSKQASTDVFDQIQMSQNDTVQLCAFSSSVATFTFSYYTLMCYSLLM